MRKDKNKKDFELDDDGTIYQLDSHWKIQYLQQVAKIVGTLSLTKVVDNPPLNMIKRNLIVHLQYVT